jgi:hypothetical protein
MRALLILGLFTMIVWEPAAAQQVTIAGRDSTVNLGSQKFLRHELRDARLVKEIYYDQEDEYLVYRLRTIYYQRCEVPADILEEWLQADSPDGYFRRQVEDSFECDSGNTPPL